MSATTSLQHVVDIDAAPSTVWELWTTSEGLRTWWARDAEVEAHVGGSIRVDIDGEHVMVGRFLELDAPHRLRFTFGWEGGDPPPEATEVDVRIDATAAGSRVTLHHHGLPLEWVEAHARGWSHFLGERLVEVEP